MGSLTLARKNLYRQKEKYFIFISIQSFITSSGIIYHGLAINIQFLLNHMKSQYFNLVIVQIINGYLNFMFFFSIITGIVVSAILCALITSARMDDLATMLSIGGTFRRIQRVPLAEIFLITLISGIIGWFGGIIGLLGLIVIFQIEIIRIVSVLDPIFGFMYIGLQLIGIYFVSGFVVNLLIRKRFQEIIDGKYSFVIIDHQRIWGVSMKRKLGFLLAYLLSKRTKVLSIVMTISVFILIFTNTFGIFGGSIIQGTTDSYIDRGYGSDIHVVCSPKITPILQELYDPFNEIIFDYSLNESETTIPPSFFEQLPPTIIYEARLLHIEKVEFLTLQGGTFPDPNETDAHFKVSSFFWGVDFQVSVFDYYLIGKSNLTDPLSVYIGDGFFKYKHNDQSLYSILIHGTNDRIERYKIEGVIVDPFAKGNCIYIDSKQLAYIFSISDDVKNVLFIKDPPNNFYELLESYNLETFKLNEYKEKYFILTSNFWVSITLCSIPIILAAALSLVAYSSLITRTVLWKDLKIIRVLGGKTSIIKSIIIWINLLNFRIAPLAILLSFSFAYSQMIAEPLLPSIEAWLFIITEFLVIGMIVYRYIQKRFSQFSCI